MQQAVKSNGHEEHARLLKAIRIADVLDGYNVDPSEVTSQVRRDAEHMSQTVGSSAATWAEALRLLTSRRQMRASIAEFQRARRPLVLVGGQPHRVTPMVRCEVGQHDVPDEPDVWNGETCSACAPRPVDEQERAPW